MNRVISSLATLTLALAFASAAQAYPGNSYEIIDVGADLRANDFLMPVLDMDGNPAYGSASSGSASASDPDEYVEGAWVPALYLDDFTGYYVVTWYQVVAIGEHIEIWVAEDLSWPEGDPRETPVITQEQIDYLVDEFDSNIYPTELDFFAEPDFHDGSDAALDDMLGFPSNTFEDDDSAGRTIAMISNIRDDNYYDPNYPSYIAGFYSPSFEYYFDRNIISIDAYDWANRVGPDGSRPYLYEGVFAHELQHLIHDDVDGDEELWVNEGCADFAGYICGYGHMHGDFFESHPENSLVLWGDQGPSEILADYGQAYLWTLYLSEQYGQDFIQHMFQNPGNGIAGVSSSLAAFRSRRDFAQTYTDFEIALLIDSADVFGPVGSGGRGNLTPNPHMFQDLDIHVDVFTPEAYDSPGAPPWGTDWIVIDDPSDFETLHFYGESYNIVPTPWTSDGDALYSGTGDEVDNWAIFEATGGGELAFDAYWDIEDYWDFAFVQVSSDGGETWTSVGNAYTTYGHYPDAMPSIVENLPGLTGWSGGVVNLSYDLTPWEGQDILIAFRYMTDWAFAYPGIWIDNVTVGGELVSDCSSTDIFFDISEIVPLENNFNVVVVGVAEGLDYHLVDMRVADRTDHGAMGLAEEFGNFDYAVMLVTHEAEQGVSHYADYEYAME